MEESERKLRGLYDRVNISVSNLNIIIIVLSILLVLCMAIGIANRGYQVSFDSLGGTAVESQKQMYGEALQAPEPPTRVGYVFDGWYRDMNLTIPWNEEEDVITEPVTLYAGWREP